MSKAKRAVPEGFHTITPQLTLDNAAQAIDWYKKAFGAEEVSRATGPDGKILHATARRGEVTEEPEPTSLQAHRRGVVRLRDGAVHK